MYKNSAFPIARSGFPSTTHQLSCADHCLHHSIWNIPSTISQPLQFDHGYNLSALLSHTHLQTTGIIVSILTSFVIFTVYESILLHNVMSISHMQEYDSIHRSMGIHVYNFVYNSYAIISVISGLFGIYFRDMDTLDGNELPILPLTAIFIMGMIINTLTLGRISWLVHAMIAFHLGFVINLKRNRHPPLAQRAVGGGWVCFLLRTLFFLQDDAGELGRGGTLVGETIGSFISHIWSVMWCMSSPSRWEGERGSIHSSTLRRNSSFPTVGYWYR